MISRETQTPEPELWDQELEPMETGPLPEEQREKEKNGFLGVFCYQLGICLAAAALLVMVNTFAPDIWQSLDRCFRQQLSRTEEFQEDGEQVVKLLQDVFGE